MERVMDMMDNVAEMIMKHRAAFAFLAMMLSDVVAFLVARASILQIAAGQVGIGFSLFGILLVVEIGVLTFTKRFVDLVARNHHHGHDALA